LILCKLIIATGDIYLFSVELTKDEAIRFKDLEFMVNHFNNLSLSPEGDDSDAVVGSMARSGSPSLHAILKELPSEDDSALSEGESSSFPVTRACSTVTSAIPIATMPPPKETPVFQTILAVPQRTAISRPDIGPLLEQSMAHQEER
jgi:hypothetical protein